MKVFIAIIFVITIGLFIAFGTSESIEESNGSNAVVEKSESKTKLPLEKPDCNIMQDEDCLDKMSDYAFTVISQGYPFTETDPENSKIDLNAFGKKGYLATGENKHGCTTVIWVNGSKKTTLYSSKYEIGETYNGITPTLCDVPSNPRLSVVKANGKTMILLESAYQRDPYGGTGSSTMGSVCEIDFIAKKLSSCVSKSVGIH